MFVLYEKDGRREAYDLTNKIQFVGANGEITCFNLDENRIFKNLKINDIIIRPDVDISCVYLWINGKNREYFVNTISEMENKRNDFLKQCEEQKIEIDKNNENSI